MKHAKFLGDSLYKIRSFPSDVKADIGYQIDKVQNGFFPDDFKPLKTVGKGVYEIRTRSSDGIYRTLYIASFDDFVYVLHAFKKKTQKTSKLDLEVAKKRLLELLK